MMIKIFSTTLLSIFIVHFFWGQNVNVSEEEIMLYEMINNYRVQNGLYSLPLSEALTITAQAHAKDLHTNRPFNDNNCNVHSWSSKGKWSACCYDEANPNLSCMTNKPQEIASYMGEGYEIVHGDTHGMYQHYTATPTDALNAWKNNAAYNSILLNKGFMWRSKNWRAMGIGIYKDFAVVWFGTETDPKTISTKSPTPPPQQIPSTTPQTSPTQQTKPVLNPPRKRWNESSIALRLSYGYHYNIANEFFNFLEFNGNAISHSFSCMMAYDMKSDLYDMLGIQITYARNESLSTERYLSTQPLLARNGILLEDSLSRNLEIEAGFIAKGFFNVKGGLGWFAYRDFVGNKRVIPYYIMTPTVDIGFRNIKTNMGVSFLFGKEFENVIVRPTFNFALQFIIIGKQNWNGRRLLR